MDSLRRPHAAGDKHIHPNCCVSLIHMDRFSPDCIYGKEKALALLETKMQLSGWLSLTAFPSPHAGRPTLDSLNLTSVRKSTRSWAPRCRQKPSRGGAYQTLLEIQPTPPTPPRLPCPSTHASPVSSHARRQGGKRTGEHGIWLPARSLQGPHPQPRSINPEPPASRTPWPPQPAAQEAANHPGRWEKGGGRFGSFGLAVQTSSFWWGSCGFLTIPSGSGAWECFQHK